MLNQSLATVARRRSELFTDLFRIRKTQEKSLTFDLVTIQRVLDIMHKPQWFLTLNFLTCEVTSSLKVPLYYVIHIYFLKVSACLFFLPCLLTLKFQSWQQCFVNTSIYFKYDISLAPQNIIPEIWCSVHGKCSFVELLMLCQAMLWRHYIVNLWYHAPWQCLLLSCRSHWLSVCCSYCQCSWKCNLPGVC